MSDRQYKLGDIIAHRKHGGAIVTAGQSEKYPDSVRVVWAWEDQFGDVYTKDIRYLGRSDPELSAPKEGQITGTCETCGATDVELFRHIWLDETADLCSNCKGHAEDEEEYHAAKNPT